VPEIRKKQTRKNLRNCYKNALNMRQATQHACLPWLLGDVWCGNNIFLKHQYDQQKGLELHHAKKGQKESQKVSRQGK
jgi:hypothetical protein